MRPVNGSLNSRIGKIEADAEARENAEGDDGGCVVVGKKSETCEYDGEPGN